MTVYRTQVKIVADILLAVRDYEDGKEGVGITLLLRKGNMPYSRMTKMLDDLVSSGLLLIHANGKGNKYTISSQGIGYLQEYSRFKEFAVAFGLRL